MFKVVKESGLGTIWLPVAYGTTVYVGQLVYKSASGDYLTTFGAAASGGDSKRPVGVIVATNDKVPTYSSTYKAHYIAGVQTQDAQIARSWQGAQGMWSLGDPIPMAQIELIGKDTVLQGTFGGALTPFNPVQANTTGDNIKIAEASKSTVDYNTIFYCRSGLNKGIYRVNTTGTNASNVTTCNFNTYWPYDIATTDSFVKANVAVGNCKLQLNANSMYVLPNDTMASNYFNVIVEDVDLSVAGQEVVTFRFA